MTYVKENTHFSKIWLTFKILTINRSTISPRTTKSELSSALVLVSCAAKWNSTHVRQWSQQDWNSTLATPTHTWVLLLILIRYIISVDESCFFPNWLKKLKQQEIKAGYSASDRMSGSQKVNIDSISPVAMGFPMLSNISSDVVPSQKMDMACLGKFLL